MSIVLPTTVAPRAAVAALRRFGVDLTPPLGGPVLRAGRMGTRFAAELTYPPLVKAQFDDLYGALVQADTEQTTVVAEFPQGPLAAVVGTPLVNGAGQAGTTLNADAFAASVTLPRGTMFSFVAGGRNYLHQIRAAIAASAGGVAALPIAPMLRASPADNVALEFTAPKIEGFVEGDEISWSLDENDHYLLTFKIFENK